MNSASSVTPGKPGRSAWFLIAICCVSALGGLLFGYDTAVISGTFGFVEHQYALSKLGVGWFASSALVGCILGAAVAGSLSDAFGRKPMLLGSALLFLAGALFSAIPQTFQLLIVARIVGGLGVGVASVVAPIYISEFAPPRVRGRLVAVYQLSIVTGILLAYFANWWLLRFAQSHSLAFGGSGFFHWILVEQVWRGMFGSALIPSGVFFILLLLVPESPRWLFKKGRRTQVLQLLTQIGGEETAHQELAGMEQGPERKTQLADLFRPPLRLPLLIAIALSVFGQLTGVNVVVYYGPTILAEAGFKMDGALQFQVGLGVINLVFTLLAMWRIDHWGRRPLLLWGMASIVGTLVLMAVLFPFKPATSMFIVLMMGIYMACIAFSICAVIWVLSAEVFPTAIRGRGLSIATFCNWSTNAITAFLFPWYVDRLGVHTAFYTFAGVCLVGTIFFWRYIPETKGRSLEEIEKFWENSRGGSLAGCQTERSSLNNVCEPKNKA